MSDKNREGGVAVVTGAGRGLGRAFSIGLAAAGMRVAAVARSADQIGETVRLIEQADALSGRFFMVPEDPAQVVARGDEVKRQDLYLLRMRGLSG